MPRRGAGQYLPVYFAPDLDPSWAVNPGILNYVSNYVPTKRGTLANFANGPTQDLSGPGTWSNAAYGKALTGYIFKKVTSGARLLIASSKRIVEFTAGGTQTDRSKSGTDYTTAATWTMTAQGNAIIAVSLANATQVSTSAAFSDLGGGSPKAQVCTSNMGFVMLGNYDDGTNQYSDGWWCSALFDYSSFTPSLATQAANGRLLATPGPIQAMVPLRDSIIAFKDDSVYVGDYVADTTNGIIWEWRLISDRVGCSSPHGVAVLNNVCYFLHKTGVYAFDGAQVTNIGNGVQKFVLGKLVDMGCLAKVQTGVDEQEGVIYFAFDGSVSSGVLSYLLFLNVNTGRWGFSAGVWQEAGTTGAVHALVHASLGDVTQWATSGSYAISRGSAPIFVGTADTTATTEKMRIPAYNAAVVNATVANANMYTGWLASGPALSMIGRLTPRLLSYGTQAATPAMLLGHARREGDQTAGQLTSAGSASWNPSDYCFDCTSLVGSEDRVLQALMTFRGAHEIGGVAHDTEFTSLQ